MIVKHIINIVWYEIELSLIEEKELLYSPWEFKNTYGKFLELTTSLTFLKVALMISYPFLVWFAT